ncbi:phosphate transport system regulatory protein PhoU [Hydrogenimonas sp.]|nr:phosphate transport system regulatory protein PhoU [Hydrogenimonas sp.]
MLSSYQEKLLEVNSAMRELAGMIEKAQKTAFDGFKNSDTRKLDEAKEALKGCGSKANEIDNEVIKTLALYGPEATELREMVGYLKMTNELVNTCSTLRSYIKNNKSLIAGEFDLGKIKASLQALHQSALNAVTSMVKMIDISQSEEELRSLYRSIKVEESKGDDLYSIVQKDLSDTLYHTDIDPLDFMTVLKLARKLERISDHATDVARLLIYIKSGGELGSG